MQAPDAPEKPAGAGKREDGAGVGRDEAVAGRVRELGGKVLRVVPVGDRDHRARIEPGVPRQKPLAEVVRRGDDGVSAAQEGCFERIAQDARRARATHLVGLAHRAPFVAVIEHDAEAAGAGERCQQELRERRSADEDHVVAPRGEAPDERALRRRLPEDLRIGKKKLSGDIREAAVASGGAGAPSGMLRRVARLECPGTRDLEVTRQVVRERVVTYGDARIRHGQHGRPHAVLWQVLGQLGYTLHAGPAYRRERIRYKESAERPSHVRTRSATPILVISMSAACPLITIAMPCRDEEAYIEACIRSVQAQDWPRDRMEILVADGMSIDATREILSRLAAEDSRIRLIDNPARIQAAGLNECVRLARGEIIVRIDVHADYAPDFVLQCVAALDRSGADNVGGAARPRARTFFQRCVAAALESPLGIGGSRYRQRDAEGFVESVWPGAFRRSVFERVGLFDPRAVTNEDAELNQRIAASGGRVYLSREIVVHYYPRESPRALARQYFKYGQGRARTLLKHGRLLAWRPALPFLWLAGELALVATWPWHPFGPWSIAGYALATGAEAVRVVREVDARGDLPRDKGLFTMPLCTAVVWGIFPVLHVSHGAGFAAGLVRYALRPDWEPAERLASGAGAGTQATAAE